MTIKTKQSKNYRIKIPPATRRDAFARLEQFVPVAGNYSATRNHDTLNLDNVSRLSPYLNARLILPEEVLSPVLESYSYGAVEKFIDEVCWKTYWRGWLEQHPSVWDVYEHERQEIMNGISAFQREKLECALLGESGIRCFDFWVQQLKQTGYLHNHARMWFASIWIFTLKLPWQLGASFFYQHLLDGDMAVNLLSWRWVAGLHTKGKHYLARESNIRNYSHLEINGPLGLNENGEAVSETAHHPFVPLKPMGMQERANESSLSAFPAGLLLFPTDLTPELGEIEDAPFSSIAVFQDMRWRIEQGLGSLVCRFYDQAFSDVIERVASHWDASVIPFSVEEAELSMPRDPAENVSLNKQPRVYTGSFDDWKTAVLLWVKTENLKRVVWYQPPYGPLRIQSDRLAQCLRREGISCVELRREWDEYFWPKATSGFFSFKKHIRNGLTELEVI